MDLSLIDRALAAGELDIVAGAATDGLIPALDLFQLADDRHYFPPYQAVFIARQDKLELLGEALESLSNSITTDDMRRMNYEVDGNKRSPREVASEWLAKRPVSR
jgi:glycine betaine/choline ABC-type transport system substrate-binding protein